MYRRMYVGAEESMGGLKKPVGGFEGLCVVVGGFA